MIKEKNLLLKSELKKIINVYAVDSKIRDLVVEEFIKRNMLGNKAIQLLTENRDIFTLNDDNDDDNFLLFVFTKAIYDSLEKLSKDNDKYFNYEKLNINNYFTKTEIETWLNFTLEKKEVSRYPYIFRNMLKVKEGHYIGRISVAELSELDSGNDVLYNFRTQRNPKINIYGFKEINIDKNKISEIESNIINDNQFPTEIKINVLKNGEDEVIFKSKDGIIGDLYINEGTMNLFDGMHRKTANSLAYLKKKDIEHNWKLEITNLSEKKASDYMVEINKQKPISKEHTENMDTNKAENVVVDFIKDIPMNDFSDMIVESNDLIYDSKAEEKSPKRKFKGLTKKSIIAIAISECFKQELEMKNDDGEIVTNKSNIKPIANHTSDVVNYIIGLNIDKFITTKNPIMTCKNIFVGYIALASKVYDSDDWKTEVKEVLNNIDFSESNILWNEIGLLNPKDASKTLRDKLYKIFSL